MKDPQAEVAELRALQQDAAEKRAQRTSAREASQPATESQEPAAEGRADPEPTAGAPDAEEEAPTWEKTLADLAFDLEGALAEIEAATRAHPALALLAAFALGTVAGQLFSRR